MLGAIVAYAAMHDLASEGFRPLCINETNIKKKGGRGAVARGRDCLTFVFGFLYSSSFEDERVRLVRQLGDQGKIVAAETVGIVELFCSST